jgi:hypothetical protein
MLDFGHKLLKKKYENWYGTPQFQMRIHISDAPLARGGLIFDSIPER